MVAAVSDPTHPPFAPGHEPGEPRGVTSPARSLLPGRLRRRVAAFDEQVDRGFDHLRGRRLPDRIFYVASELGDFGLIWHLIAVARGLRGGRFEREAVRVPTILGAESILVNGLIKSFFRRTRPMWDQPRAYRIRRPRSSSFPSGHASSAMTAAAVLGEHDPLVPLYYAAGAVVAASRVYVKIHHASDVVAGVATGLLLGRLFRRLWPATPPAEWERPETG